MRNNCAKRSGKQMNRFVIEDGILKAFLGKGQVIVVPDGVVQVGGELSSAARTSCNVGRNKNADVSFDSFSCADALKIRGCTLKVCSSGFFIYFGTIPFWVFSVFRFSRIHCQRDRALLLSKIWISTTPTIRPTTPCMPLLNRFRAAAPNPYKTLSKAQ